jgi:hypothetical protein
MNRTRCHGTSPPGTNAGRGASGWWWVRAPAGRRPRSAGRGASRHTAVPGSAARARRRPPPSRRPGSRRRHRSVRTSGSTTAPGSPDGSRGTRSGTGTSVHRRAAGCSRVRAWTTVALIGTGCSAPRYGSCRARKYTSRNSHRFGSSRRGREKDEGRLTVLEKPLWPGWTRRDFRTGFPYGADRADRLGQLHPSSSAPNSTTVLWIGFLYPSVGSSSGPVGSTAQTYRVR